ncbi:TetR/AcrR family transcriptional regulator [Herbaspirillum camelliae]|uniref:TetR/AcrR family transcriptional regulator n=1 Tax=Herbaspirillum camelliae TaxID=1892903 RepID=UPI000949E09D|nr:TetR/AcrR family transcriptional regulator [Herbaspirillum camelliae]
MKPIDPSETHETATARRRKEQVLHAAAQCFRQEGFHQTSMAKISNAAGMSLGHIYHYFKSKESIIEGIVAREHSELSQLIADVTAKAEKTADPVAAIMEHTPKSIARYMAPHQASLGLDILAESSRNLEVAALIQQNDAEVQQAFYDLLGSNLPEVKSRCEIVAALLEGLSARTLRNPKINDILDHKMLLNVLKHILTEAC